MTRGQFFHEVAPGAADRSYGIQVARLAGLPDAVVARAKDVLTQLESSERHNPALTLVDDLPLFSAELHREKKKAETAGPSPLDKRIADIHPDDLTPREALELIYELKRLSAGKPGA